MEIGYARVVLLIGIQKRVLGCLSSFNAYPLYSKKDKRLIRCLQQKN